MWIQGSQASFWSKTVDWWLSFLQCLLNGSMSKWVNEWTEKWAPPLLLPLSANNFNKANNSNRPILQHKPIHLMNREQHPQLSSCLVRISFSGLHSKACDLFIQAKWKSICTQMGVYECFSQLSLYCQNLEIIQRSLNWRTDKLWHIHTMKFYLSIQINKLLIHRAWVNLNDSCFSSKKPVSKRCVWYTSVYIMF